MRALTWVSVASAILLAASSASGADVIRDRNEFSVDLTKADLCFVHPIELRRTEACATFAPTKRARRCSERSSSRWRPG